MASSVINAEAQRRPKALGVVIARGGSKGFPGKALRMFDGRPLVGHALRHALDSRTIDHVVLSSDASAILNVGRSMGVTAIERPAELADDQATIDAAVRHAVEQWERSDTPKRTRDAPKPTLGHVAILYGNIALRPPDLTDRAIEHLRRTGADSVQSVYHVGHRHPYWMRKLVGPERDRLDPVVPNRVYRRQDLPPVFMLNSGVLAVTRDSLFRVDPEDPHAFLGDDRRAIVTDEDDVIDVDSPLDLRVAEAVLAHRREATRLKKSG